MKVQGQVQSLAVILSVFDGRSRDIGSNERIKEDFVPEMTFEMTSE